MKDWLRITLPVVPDAVFPNGFGGRLEVNSNSPLSHHKALEILGRYFNREFHYDEPPYFTAEARVNPPDRQRSFLWCHSKPGSGSFRAVGACSFEVLKQRSGKIGWALTWAWFHPFERRRGHLSSSWDFFVEEFGQFHCVRPLSADMERFLSTREPDFVRKQYQLFREKLRLERSCKRMADEWITQMDEEEKALNRELPLFEANVAGVSEGEKT